MTLLVIILLPFVAALALAVCPHGARRLPFAMAGGATVVGLGLLLMLAPAVLRDDTMMLRLAWVPSLDLELSLWLDPLGLLFAGLILGIGLLVVIYAQGYLATTEATGRFLAGLMLFQGAMLGVALANNIVLMLVFWELTSLASFLLIGFWRHRADARQGARMALAITGGGGLALIAGLLLLGQVAGSHELATILTRGDIVRASPLYPAILILILLGAFTKSAQFPFHFWLPHAMAAPTPVSAYLHSATMVKAGVFLLARLWPALAGSEMWFVALVTTGLVTMIFGAAVALFRHDLKAILAYSTISQLGLIVMLLGLGTVAAATAAVLHIVNHAVFKAALFMNAGIIDHETGTRDIRQLGGLATLLPLTATGAMLAAASMAGLPPLGGFISKEMMLEESLHAPVVGALLPTFAVLGALLSVAYSLRYAFSLYAGLRRTGAVTNLHDPGPLMLAPHSLLALSALALGLLPMALAGPLVAAAAGAVTGTAPPELHLALWHGVNPALLLSLAAIAGGALLVRRQPGLARRIADLPRPDAKRMFDAALRAITATTRSILLAVHAGSVQRYLLMLFIVAVVLGIDGALTAGGVPAGTRTLLPATPVAIVAWFALLAATLAVVLMHRQRFLVLVFISVIGLVIALAFVRLSAPDLALTQITVEVVTILLMLLALNLLPKHPATVSSTSRRLRDAAVALVAGGGSGWLAYALMTRPPRTHVSDFHWANSYSGGGGTNVVNVTLVDFRAFDTMGEIIVLGIAGLTIYALLEPAARGTAGKRLRQWREDMLHSPESHPVLFVMVARLLLPLALMVGIYVFLRGHNQPGGGFIAALIFSIAILLQYLASGYEWTDERRRIGEHAMIAWGVLLAVATGLGSLAFGAPFMSTAFDYFHLPLIGEFELATAMLFDLGVASVVVGAVVMALAQLSNVAQRAASNARDHEAKHEGMTVQLSAPATGRLA